MERKQAEEDEAADRQNKLDKMEEENQRRRRASTTVTNGLANDGVHVVNMHDSQPHQDHTDRSSYI